MAATLGNAIKALLENSNLGIAAYRDAAPSGEQKPYVTIREGISVTNDDRGGGDNGASETVIEMVQVDVWEDWKDEDGEHDLESPTLAQRVQRTLHGARLDAAPSRVYGVYAPSRRRLLEQRNNVVHNAITATVHRIL